MLLNKCPITMLNRKYYPSHSIFDTRKFSDHVHTVLLHSNKRIEKTTVHFDDVTKVISADMRPKDYEKFWSRVWSQELPVLTINREKGLDVFETVDLAKKASELGDCQ